MADAPRAADLTLRGFDVRLYGRSHVDHRAHHRSRRRSNISGVARRAHCTDRQGHQRCRRCDSRRRSRPHDGADACACVRWPKPSRRTSDGRIRSCWPRPEHTRAADPERASRQRLPCAGVLRDGDAPLYCAQEQPGRGPHHPGGAPSSSSRRFQAIAQAELAELIRPVYPSIQPGTNLLETVFPYTNAIHHPPAILCNSGRVEATGGDYYHYYDGISPSVGRMIDALDRERLRDRGGAGRACGALRRALPSHRLHHGRRARRPASPMRRFTKASRTAGSGAVLARSPLSQRGRARTGSVLLSELGRLANVRDADHRSRYPSRLHSDRHRTSAPSV